MHWTGFLKSKDPRCPLPKMTDAEKAELNGLFQKGTFRIIVLPERHRDNVAPSKFVLAVKHENREDIFKARFVLGGHRDGEKRNMLNSDAALSQTSMRLLLAVSSIFDFQFWTTDVAQASLQSASTLRRRIFLRPVIFELGPQEYLQ